MTSRRTFLTSLSALSGSLVLGPPRSTHAPTVRATSTVLFGRPDDTRNLVRFQISGLDAPAGRLRVYSHSQQLIGTAGVLPRGDVLEGELWLPVSRATNVVSVLEAPGLQQPLRTSHRLDPQKKWTIYLFSIVDADDIDSALASLPPLQRGIQAAMYGRAGVTINPLPRERAAFEHEHIAFLRMTSRACQLERAFGVRVSRVAVVGGEWQIEPSVVTALAGSSVGLVTNASLDNGLVSRWEAPDTSSLLAIGGTVASPEELALAGAVSYSTAGVERLLMADEFASSTYDHDVAVVVNRALVTLPGELIKAVANWNSRFAYPRIVLNGAADLSERLSQHARSTSYATFTQPSASAASVAEIGRAATKGVDAVSARTDAILNTLADRLPGSDTGLEAMARQVETVVPGTLVFNPSPFVRSELVTMTDGTTRIATQVPPLGYAVFPDLPAVDPAPAWEPVSAFTDLRGQTTRIRLDDHSGAIRSMQLIDEPGRQWVQPGSEGLNGVPRAQLERRVVHRIPGVATRVTAYRRSSRLGAFTSTMTLYDELPWIDIENSGTPSSMQACDYVFAVALETPELTWEIPAGIGETRGPQSTIKHLRWIRLADSATGLGAVLLRGLDAPYASVDGTGRLTSHAPAGRSRYRIAISSEPQPGDAAWRFGWNADPLRVVRVERKSAGRLPRFGSIIAVSHPGIAVLGIKAADDGDGVIVFLQELFGEARRIRLRSGLIRFGVAQTVDYVERNIGQKLVIEDDRVTVALAAHGVAAVRLSQITLAGA